MMKQQQTIFASLSKNSVRKEEKEKEKNDNCKAFHVTCRHKKKFLLHITCFLIIARWANRLFTTIEWQIPSSFLDFMDSWQEIFDNNRSYKLWHIFPFWQILLLTGMFRTIINPDCGQNVRLWFWRNYLVWLKLL